MKKEDVPQHGDLTAGCREVSYAVDADGRYHLELSAGWEAKNIALRQAWEAITEELQEVIAEIARGRKSPLAYHMVKHQMDPVLLSQYSGIACWRVKRHLKPAVFARLEPATLMIYADLFSICIETLRQVPLKPDLLPAEYDSSAGSRYGD